MRENYNNYTYNDCIIDYGFHHKHKGIKLNWNIKQMKSSNELDIINEIYMFFKSYGGSITDIEINGIQKTVLLTYCIFSYASINGQFSNIWFKTRAKWCFNRKISFNINH